MGPGTGFGLAALASDHDAEVVLVTEAGHATLASENRREDAIILALRERPASHLGGAGTVRPRTGQLYHVIAHIDGGTAPERTVPTSSRMRLLAIARHVARRWMPSARSWAASPATLR